jgi:hypothetical protein
MLGILSRLLMITLNTTTILSKDTCHVYTKVSLKRQGREIDKIVKFYSAETIWQIARETGFVERGSKLGSVEFLGIMTAGLFV